MTDRRYLVGEKVLVSRTEDGKHHEEALVVDFYELVIGDEKRPMVVVDLPDGERKWMTAAPPNVLPIDEPGGASDAGPHAHRDDDSHP